MTHRCLQSFVRHGVCYAPGDPIDLDGRAAERMESDGMVKPAGGSIGFDKAVVKPAPPKPAAPKPAAAAAIDTTATVTPATGTTSTESRSIGDVGLPDSVVALLRGAEIETVAEARAYHAKHGSFEPIRRIGPQANQQIIAAIAD